MMLALAQSIRQPLIASLTFIFSDICGLASFDKRICYPGLLKPS